MGSDDIRSTMQSGADREAKIKSAQDLIDEEEKRKKAELEQQRIRLMRNRGGSLLAATDVQNKTTLG